MINSQEEKTSGYAEDNKELTISNGLAIVIKADVSIIVNDGSAGDWISLGGWIVNDRVGRFWITNASIFGLGLSNSEPPLPEVALVVTTDGRFELEADKFTSAGNLDLLVLAIEARCVEGRNPVAAEGVGVGDEEGEQSDGLHCCVQFPLIVPRKC